MCFVMNNLLSVKKPYSTSKRVAFAPENETFSIPSFHSDKSSSSPAQKSDLWYRPEDLAGFREEVRHLCHQLRYPGQNPLADGSIRGLESRLCPERKRRKYMSNRCIVYASKKSCHAWDADRLAALCRKINEWSTELAVMEGARDFDRAYCEGRKRSQEMEQS